MPRIFGFYEMQPRAKITLIGILALVILASSVMYVQAYHRLKPVYQVKTDSKVVALTLTSVGKSNTHARYRNIERQGS